MPLVKENSTKCYFQQWNLKLFTYNILLLKKLFHIFIDRNKYKYGVWKAFISLRNRKKVWDNHCLNALFFPSYGLYFPEKIIGFYRSLSASILYICAEIIYYSSFNYFHVFPSFEFSSDKPNFGFPLPILKKSMFYK